MGAREIVVQSSQETEQRLGDMDTDTKRQTDRRLEIVGTERDKGIGRETEREGPRDLRGT